MPTRLASPTLAWHTRAPRLSGATREHPVSITADTARRTALLDSRRTSLRRQVQPHSNTEPRLIRRALQFQHERPAAQHTPHALSGRMLAPGPQAHAQLPSVHQPNSARRAARGPAPVAATAAAPAARARRAAPKSAAERSACSRAASCPPGPKNSPPPPPRRRAPVTACPPWTPGPAGCSSPAAAAPSFCSQRCTRALPHTYAAQHRGRCGTFQTGQDRTAPTLPRQACQGSCPTPPAPRAPHITTATRQADSKAPQPSLAPDADPSLRRGGKRGQDLRPTPQKVQERVPPRRAPHLCDAQNTRSQRHLKPVRPTRLPQEKQRPGFFCTGRSSASDGPGAELRAAGLASGAGSGVCTAGSALASGSAAGGWTATSAPSPAALAELHRAAAAAFSFTAAWPASRFCSRKQREQRPSVAGFLRPQRLVVSLGSIQVSYVGPRRTGRRPRSPRRPSPCPKPGRAGPRRRVSRMVTPRAAWRRARARLPPRVWAGGRGAHPKKPQPEAHRRGWLAS